MALVSLVSIYDAFLGRTIRTIFEVCPELLSASDRTLTLSELSVFSSIEDARSHMIDEEVQSLLRKSHSDQFSWFESKLGITLRKELDSWSSFVEVTERRNLFVHADGDTSKQYLQVCGRLMPDDKLPSLGERLQVTPDYFDDACDCFSEIVVKLSQVLWRKLGGNSSEILEKADSALIETTYHLLLSRDYKPAEKILKFGTKKPVKLASVRNEITLKINLAISLKAQEGDREALLVLDEIDWSALTDEFQIANAVLRDDFGSAAEIMKRIGSDGALSIAEYREWPLFRWFRKSTEFLDAYEDVFGEPYVVDRPNESDDAENMDLG